MLKLFADAVSDYLSESNCTKLDREFRITFDNEIKCLKINVMELAKTGMS